MVERLGWTLVHFVWEGAAIAGLLAIILALAKRRSARFRYALACLALTTLALAPVITFLELGGESLRNAVVSPVSQGSVVTAGETILYRDSVFDNLLPILVRIWIVGVVLLSLRLGGTLIHVERWRRRNTRPADVDWQNRLDSLALSLGIRRSISLLMSDQMNVPSAWGILKAVVVLPTSIVAQLSPAQVETILLHELAHIRRHDYFVNLLQAVIETVLFYHPAVWWVSAIVRREREHCCDDVVVARLADPMLYARALLHLEERRLTLPRPTLSAKESNLMNRIARILTPRPTPARVSPLASTMAAAAVLAAVLGGTLQAQAQAKSSAQKKTSKISPKSKVLTKKSISKVAPVAKPAVAPKAAPLGKLASTAKGTKTLSSLGTTETVAENGFVDFRWEPLQGKYAVLPDQTGPAKVSNVRKAVRGQMVQNISIRSKGAEVRNVDRVAAAVGSTTEVRASGVASVAGVSSTGQQVGAIGGGSVTGVAQGGFGGGSSFGGGISEVGAARGFGYNGPNDPELNFSVEVDRGTGLLSIDAKTSGLSPALRILARRSKSSVVIKEGVYDLVSLVLSDVTFDSALKIICETANATWRKEGNVYYISPKVGTKFESTSVRSQNP